MRKATWCAIGAIISLPLWALPAQPERAGDREQQLRQQIGELQDETGHARPAELVEPLLALALFYEEGGDYALASATLQEARHVTRVHNGLTSAEEALLLRQQIRNEKALGLHGRAWNLEQEMVTMARHHLDDPRMLPIFRELAEDRLRVMAAVNRSERPPTIYAGCYNRAPLPPYDFTRRDARAIANSGGYTSPSCIGGINQDLIAKLRSEVLMYYADAIEIILREGDYANEELRELERAAIRIADHPTSSTIFESSESTGTASYCSRGTLAWYVGLDILSSCLAPVSRFNNVVSPNVGGRISLIRLLSYEVRSGAPVAVRARALADLADWHLYKIAPDRRRFASVEFVNTVYQSAYDQLQQAGEAATLQQLFTSELPTTLPTYVANPFVALSTRAARYVDVSFDLAKHGGAENVELLAASDDVTREEKREVLRLLERITFRPRPTDGTFGESARVAVRYPLP